MNPETPILEVDDIRKSFGALRAVDGCSFTVKQGAIVGLIGPNGAGKSTLFDIAAGGTFADEGHIRFQNQDIGHLKPHQRARLGLGRTFQLTRVFPRMTVRENMLASAPNKKHLHDRTEHYLDLVKLTHMGDQYASSLSYGQQKLLELARVLMLDPQLILLDEPAAGVNPTLLNSLLEFIHYLRDQQGKSFLIIEHNMKVIMGHCDKIIVMNAGRVLTEGTAAEVQANPQVLEAYFGTARAHRKP